MLDCTSARSSALDYSLSRKPALGHYPTRDSVLHLNLALNPSSKTPYKFSKPHNPSQNPPLNPSHFQPSNLSLHSPHIPTSNQSTGTDYKPDKSPPNPINTTISAKPPSKNITLILGDSNTKYTFIPNSICIATYVIEDIDPEMCMKYKSVWIHCGVNNNNFVHSQRSLFLPFCPPFSHYKIINLLIFTDLITTKIIIFI